MKKIKNAFTLIELLAVIIILAIVALIATPIILNVIEDVRISAGRSEANMILGGINNYCATEDVKYQLDNNYTKICTSEMDKEDVPTMVNLGNAEISSIKYNGSKLTELVIESNNHTFTLCSNGKFAMDDEECDGEVALVGMPIIEKAKELVYDNGACKTDGTTYQYMSGCYVKGKSTNNYIWYSGFLWRIMGINADGTVRLITDENVTSISWGVGNTAENWDRSYAKDWLNNYFYPKLKGNKIIKEEIWCSETTEDKNSARTNCTNNSSKEKSKVGLITIDEYNLGGGRDSYLNIGQYQWTMTPYSSSNVWIVRHDGDTLNNGVSSTGGLRVVINVNSNAIITGGNGKLVETWSNQSGPFILNEYKNIELIGKLNEKVTSGEYVIFAGKKYRVIDKDSNGNIKLILDGYYEENGSIFEMKYGDDNIFSTTTGIGQKLNNDVLNWITNNDEIEKEKLVSDYTWYQNEFAYDDSYTVSLDETDSTRSINATVGLIRVGEILSSQSSSILTHGYTVASNYNKATSYWTMTPYTSSSNAWSTNNSGDSVSYEVAIERGLRAAIVVKSDITIIGGDGTWSNPYKI